VPLGPSAEANVIADFQRAFSTFAAQSLATSGPLRHLRVVDIDCSAERAAECRARVSLNAGWITHDVQSGHHAERPSSRSHTRCSAGLVGEGVLHG
jgi:hypothetical protein